VEGTRCDVRDGGQGRFRDDENLGALAWCRWSCVGTKGAAGRNDRRLRL